MTNKSIAKQLKFVADALELTGGNPFKVKTYANAAFKIERLEINLFAHFQSGEKLQTTGIGKGISADVEALFKTGTFPLMDELATQIPSGIFEILQIRGLGIKKVQAIWQFGIDNLNDLEKALQENRLQITGFGDKIKQNILAQIPIIYHNKVRRRFADALSLAHPILKTLEALQGIQRVKLVGEMRRKLPVVSGIDILVATPQELIYEDGVLCTKVAERPEHHPIQFEVAPFFLCNIIPCYPLDFELLLWEKTATKAYQKTFEQCFHKPRQVKFESEIYTQVGLPPIPPELKETGAEILEIQQKGKIPQLIQVSDLKGSLHNHSTYSDGANSLREMATACIENGLEYFGIADHSQSLKIAFGMPVEKVLAQRAEIEKLNTEFEQDGLNFRIFGGIESDILDNGALDYEDDILAGFDFVVASIHQNMQMDEEKATKRLIKAIENPFTTILGHPTGRLLLKREGYPIDTQKVLEACAANGVSVELNANPYRLDLDWTWIRKATDMGIKIAISPDAHSIAQLAYVEWGVYAARKGWLTAENCLNAMNRAAFEQWLKGI